MIVWSLIINLVVLVPVVSGLFLNGPRITQVFGGKSTAREILLCMYLGILLMSAWLLMDDRHRMAFAPSVLLLQVVYKVLSGLLIRDRHTPVLWFNLAIAAFHSVTLAVIAFQP